MKKRRIVLGTLGGLILVLCAVFLCLNPFAKEDWEGLEVVNVACNRMLYESLEGVEEEATIIVEAEAGNVLDQVVSSFYDSTFQKDLPSAGYTRRELKIEKVHQGDVNVGDKIVLMQDYFIWTNTDNIKQLISLTGLKPMKKGEKYLLFLAWDKNKEGYYAVGDFQGVYPLEDTTVKSKEGSVAAKRELEHVYSREDYSSTLIPIYDEVQKKYRNK